MSEIHDDLRATIEDIAADAAKLQQVETRKGELDPSDPALLRLAEQAENLGEQIAIKTSIELGLAKEAAG